MPIHTGRLLLTPADPRLAVPIQDLRLTLEQVRFIGETLPEAKPALMSQSLCLAACQDQGGSQSPGIDQNQFQNHIQDQDQNQNPLQDQFHNLDQSLNRDQFLNRDQDNDRDPDREAPASTGQGGSQDFLPGDHFLNLLVFAGCSVHVDLAPPSGGGPFTHIRLLGPFPHPRLLAGRNTRPPRCPACRDPYRDWRAALISAAIPTWICSSCASALPAWAWDWKHQGGYGRTIIAVEEVFPGEAEPAPTLLEALQRLTATPWRHFYVQDETT